MQIDISSRIISMLRGFRASTISSAAADIARNPALAAVLLDAGGFPLKAGMPGKDPVRIVFDQLPSTLRMIAREGSKTIRNGDVAAAVLRDLRELGGVIGPVDLARPVPGKREARTIRIGSTKVSVPSGLSGGITLQEILKQIADMDPPDSPGGQFYEAILRAGRRTLRARLSGLGNGDASLTHPSCTTSFSVVDRDGMVVSATITLVSAFGSKVLSPSTGILLNNAISWFDPAPGKPNSLGPDKPCLSNMCPSVLTADDGSVTAIGGAGGRKIITTVAQVIAYCCFAGLSVEDALSVPRIDYQDSGPVLISSRASEDAIAAIRQSWPVIVVEPVCFPNPFAIATAATWRPGQAVGHACPDYPMSGVGVA